MAIYHVNIRHIKSPKSDTGQRTVAQCKYDYLNRENRWRAKHGELAFIESGNLPAWVGDSPRSYWSTADQFERANARMATHIEYSLPREADLAEQIKIARNFIADITKTNDGRSLPYSMAIHHNDGNPHVHIMLSDRANDGIFREREKWFTRAATGKKSISEGGAMKARELKNKDWLLGVREKLETRLNDFLQSKNLTLVSRDTLKAQGLSRAPQIHLSPVAAAIEKRTGKKTLRGDQWRAHNDIIKAEAKLAAATTEVAKISAIAPPPSLPLESKTPKEAKVLKAQTALDESKLSRTIQARTDKGEIEKPAQETSIITPAPKVEPPPPAAATNPGDELLKFLKLIELAEAEREKAHEEHREKKAAFETARATRDKVDTETRPLMRSASSAKMELKIWFGKLSPKDQKRVSLGGDLEQKDPPWLTTGAALKGYVKARKDAREPIESARPARLALKNAEKAFADAEKTMEAARKKYVEAYKKVEDLEAKKKALESPPLPTRKVHDRGCGGDGGMSR